MNKQLLTLDLELDHEVETLLPSFLESAAEHKAATDLWNQMIEEISLALGSQETWTSWGEMSDRVAQEDWDLYPIAGRCCKAMEKAFRVLQHAPPEGDRFIFGAWVAEYEENWTSFPRHELFMSLTLSRESLGVARRLLEEWMNPSSNPESMARTFATLEAEFARVEG